MKVFVLLFAGTAMLGLCLSVVISRCDLAKGLVVRGVGEDKLNDWICLAESESNRDTQAVNKVNSDGSWDYGIFQLNSRYWCQGQKTEANECGLQCTSLLSDSLDPSTKCAMKVFKVQGFQAWVGWRNKCEGKNISFLTTGCNL